MGRGRSSGEGSGVGASGASRQIGKGDSVVFTSRYAGAQVGKTGRVVKVWTPSGRKDQQVRVDFGKNLGGQRLRQTVPVNVLQVQ